MNQREAIKDTIRWAVAHGLHTKVPQSIDDPFSYVHFVDMLHRIEGADAIGQPFDDAKIGRWLGWMQAAAVASAFGFYPDPAIAAEKLQEMKHINQKWASVPDAVAAAPKTNLVDATADRVVERIIGLGLGLWSDKMLTEEEKSRIKAEVKEATVAGIKEAADALYNGVKNGLGGNDAQ